MRAVSLLVLVLAACGGRPDRDPRRDAGADPQDSGLTPLEVPEDNISNAIGTCLGRYREPDRYPNQLAPGDELQRYTLRDPRAVCNDGTPGVLYVRAATDPELADVWELHVQGGGGCGAWATCVQRWCGLDYYDSSKMSSADLPEQVAGFGIYDETSANLLSGANHAYFYYCSSDGWGGQSTLTYQPPEPGTDEATGIEVPEGLPSFTMFAHGHFIVTAAIDELEAGIVSDVGESLPPMRDARVIVWNGTSAGSHGAVRHADWLSERVAANGTEVVAIFDAALTPPHEYFDEAHAGIAREYTRRGWDARLAASDQLPYMDESCMRTLGPTADAWRCDHAAYVMLNHVTTPFFARQDLRDALDMGAAVGLTEDEWESTVRSMLRDLVNVPTEGVEGADVTVTPGAYGPNCSQHVALEMSDWWRVGTVRGADGVDYTYQDAFFAWYRGARVQVVDEVAVGSGDGPLSSCPNVSDER
jgi:hypothetical protein